MNGYEKRDLSFGETYDTVRKMNHKKVNYLGMSINTHKNKHIASKLKIQEMEIIEKGK